MSQQTYAITQKYQGTFDKAITDITNALQQEGFGILTHINVQETLMKKLDVDYSRYQILGACNPTYAYKALQAEKQIGLLLPCNVIVYEEQDEVYISIMKPTAALTLSHNTDITSIANKVETKLRRALHQVKSDIWRYFFKQISFLVFFALLLSVMQS